MQAAHTQVLTEILDDLVAFSRDGILPQEARARLRVLQQRYPNTALELLWEEEAFDRSVHYDALLHFSEHGTISVSFCPDRALPWPLRGVQRWSNADLVRVNNQTVTIDQAIALLDFIWDDAPIMKRLLNTCLIRQYLEHNPIELSDAELQRAMDGYRRARQLYTVSQTRTWMAQQGLTYAQLEQLVSEQASIAKLRDQMTEAQIETYFEAHRREFDVAYVARFDFVDEKHASAARSVLEEGSGNFLSIAQVHFVEMMGTMQALFTTIRRFETPQEIAERVFAATIGETVGPMLCAHSYALFKLLAIEQARLDDKTRRVVKHRLFEDWLSVQRQAARVEWFWGNAGHTLP